MDVETAKRRAADWWGGVPRPRRTMLVALALLFGSHFLLYGDATRYYLTNATDLTRYTGMRSYSELVGGWELHPQAGPIMLVLAGLFGTRIADAPTRRRWVYWLGAALVFVAVIPASPVRAIGGLLGLVAFGIAVRALLLARKEPVG